MTRPARLPRDVPEKAEAFLRVALCAASDELPSFVAMIAWLAAPDQRKASFFQTHHGAGMDGWRVVAYYYFHSCLHNKYAGDLPLFTLNRLEKEATTRLHS
ncbi:hypothetical protein [Variovorax sp. PCZ-1]|uniref:hypothetical protein n=1 Tax=Variovorax sp. PCZ-1 TaxID=2835533 RepID=UPI001BCFBB6E|nr:hypothetical protein [Variovorax sp. PCZ-1]MBS7808863.1 hypothetical protein [Variovorax sp. PCZ-1]